MKKRTLIVLIIALIPFLFIGFVYRWFINEANDAKYNQYFMCDWKKQIMTGCINKVNRPDITNEELADIMKRNKVSKNEVIDYINNEIVLKQNQLSEKKKGNENYDSIEFIMADLKRLETANKLIMNLK